MAGKDKNDPAAAFFGESDLDWLAEEEDSAAGEADDESKETLPVAPPPPPPFQKTAQPLDADQGWADRQVPPPDDKKPVASAPTLIFSSVPTLPPEPSPDLGSDDDASGDASEAEQPTVEVDRDRAAAIARDAGAAPKPSEVATQPAEPPPEAAAPEPVAPQPEPPAPEPEPEPEPTAPADEDDDPAVLEDETEAVFGDALEGQGEETPLVRSHDPAPARVQTPPPAVRRAESPLPPAPKPPSAPPKARYEPPAAREGWRAAGRALVAEADQLAEDAQRAALLFEGGRLLHGRLDDLSGAYGAYRAARDAGERRPELTRAEADIAGRTHRFADQAKLLEQLAEQLEGAAELDARLEAALVRSRNLDDTQGAIEQLWKAAAIEPREYTSRALLRAYLPASDERLEVLDQLAQAAEGGMAADARVEQARALLQAGRTDEAMVAFRQALQHEPGHGDAFLGLEKLLAGDDRGLALLFRDEAKREGQIEPGWWNAKAGRQFLAAGLGKDAVDAFAAAVADGYVFAEREQQGGFSRAGAHTELAASVASEAEALTPESGLAFALYRLGWIRETRLGDRASALEAYQAALEADPASDPARDAVVRMLDSEEQIEQVRAFWTQRLATARDDEERAFVSLRLGEVAEAGGDEAEARERFESVLDITGEGTVAQVAIEALLRVYDRLGDYEALAGIHERRAATTDDPAAKARHLVAGARVGPRELADADRARQLFRRALEVQPDNPTALEAMALLLEEQGDFTALAEHLRSAGDAAADSVQRCSYLYRAARLYTDRLGELETSRACLEHAIAADPAFQPARWMLSELGGSSGGDADADLYREQAERARDTAGRCWALFAAALLADSPEQARADLGQILSQRPDHPGALALLEVQSLAEGDTERLVDLYRGAIAGTPSEPKARLAVRVADLLIELDRVSEAREVLADLATWDVEDRPLRAASRLAGAIGAWDVALSLLAPLDTLEDRAERARLASIHGEPADALAALFAILDDGADPAGVGARAVTVAQQVGDAEAMLRAYRAIADGTRASSLRAAYGAWTAMTIESAGGDAAGDALPYWRHALSVRPESPAAFLGVERGLVATGDADGLIALYAADDDPLSLADALSRADADERAAEVLSDAWEALADDAGPEARLPLLVRLELVREGADDWQGAYDALTTRRELARDPTQIEAIDGKRRWVLAEKLAETDEAWELYRTLHDEAPDDRDVTEALARIAGARGETAVAIGYLKELADAASDATEAARYQRRIGEAYERADDVASARQAYLDALDHVPDDAAALDGLKRLARQEEDWGALVAVLQREAGLSEGGRLLELRRQIARVTEEHMDDTRVAIDAWRALLDLDGSDREGLERVLELSEQESEWALFVEAGAALADQLPWDERRVLLRRVGIACQEQLERDDAIRYLEQAIASEPPDYDAALRLEQLYRSRADWNGAVRALSTAASADVDEDRQVAALLRAARLEIEARHDREAAASFYNRVLEVRPDHRGALRFMASHLYEAGRFEEALPISERLEPMVEEGQDLDDFDTRMELSTFYFYLGQLLREHGDEPSEALSRFERALELNPTHLVSLEVIGPMYTEVGEWKKAERVYRQLLQLSGGQGDKQKVASTYTHLGLVERELGNQEKAYKRFNKALELHPNHVGALKGMALILEDRKDWSNLLNVYNNIIYHATVPGDVIHAYMTKGRILDDHMQRQDKAAQHYQRSLDFDPNQPAAHARLSELAMRREAYEEAAAIVDKALDLDAKLVKPVRGVLLLVRAAALKHAGDDAGAERALREAQAFDSELVESLGNAPLSDLERLRVHVKGHLPR